MKLPLPADTPLEVRLRLFDEYLANKYERTDAELQEHLDNLDRRPILKAERAEVAIIQARFQALFERELRQS